MACYRDSFTYFFYFINVEVNTLLLLEMYNYHVTLNSLEGH
jgi:hypothetical protein